VHVEALVKGSDSATGEIAAAVSGQGEQPLQVRGRQQGAGASLGEFVAQQVQLGQVAQARRLPEGPEGGGVQAAAAQSRR
jgi:hypothetical protein